MNKIINFHDICDAQWFENVICFLKNRYKLVNQNELIEYYDNGINFKNICHITVDDGDKTFYEVIYPVLKKHKVPASIFVSPDAAINQVNFWFQEIKGYDNKKMKQIASEYLSVNITDFQEFSINNILKCCEIDLIWRIINEYRKRYKIEIKSCNNMTVDQLLKIENSGLISIGAHSMRHPVLANEEMENSKNEIQNSINNLANILDHSIESFAYPNGSPKFDFGIREMDILRGCNCKISFSTETANFNLNTNLLSFPRFGLSFGSNNFIRAKFILGSYWEKLRNLKSKTDYSERKELLKLLG